MIGASFVLIGGIATTKKMVFAREKEKNKMENTKMQPGKIYITTDDGKKLEFFGVVEFKPDTNEPLLIVEKTRCIDRPLRFIYEGKDITDQVEGMRHEIFTEGNRLIPDKHEQLTIETRRATLRFWDREFIMR